MAESLNADPFMDAPSSSDPFDNAGEKIMTSMTVRENHSYRQKRAKLKRRKKSALGSIQEEKKIQGDVVVNRIGRDQDGKIVRIENEDGTVRYGPLEERRNK
ncbi:hypothetical protein UFOVP861_7 [uncultured Caudovirales phage]|uniref:Uncharacterized protein n=1 Tax=uncultured Caudovirales phage TaxID=2100421 RepID=A0A6J5PDJ5_9CAUD|nr:hypothetical protein UFOVP861_7 [uncultured Caudovirales phage]